MGMIKLLFAPIRRIVRFPLFQLAIVVAVILFLQSANENSAFGQIFNGLDKLVDATVTFFSAIFAVKSFTKSWLTSGFMIAYVYLGCLLILFLVRVTIRVVVDFIGRSNLFWLRNAIARERVLRPIEHGCRSRESGQRTYLRKNGNRHLLGPLITNRPIRR
jgi:hypothetical protein